MSNNRTHWLNKLRKLNPNRSTVKGVAPHKACLLLSLLDMAEDGELVLQGTEVRKSPGLHVRFNAFSSLTLPRWGGRVELSYPFFYLKTQGFWLPMNEEGRTASSADETRAIKLDPEFLELMYEKGFRRDARIILVETYFPPEERLALYALLGVRDQTPEFEKERATVEETAAAYAVEKGRSARFAVQVVCGYEHTCALTGYRIITREGASIVEAAHIEPWAATRNDDVLNGLALSRNAHWAFDRGLWSVGDDLRILIQKDRFQEWGPDFLFLEAHHGRMLQLAQQTTLRPSPNYLQRHRQKWGFD